MRERKRKCGSVETRKGGREDRRGKESVHVRNRRRQTQEDRENAPARARTIIVPFQTITRSYSRSQRWLRPVDAAS